MPLKRKACNSILTLGRWKQDCLLPNYLVSKGLVDLKDQHSRISTDFTALG
jgi:hypothetical protein